MNKWSIGELKGKYYGTEVKYEGKLNLKSGVQIILQSLLHLPVRLPTVGVPKRKDMTM